MIAPRRRHRSATIALMVKRTVGVAQVHAVFRRKFGHDKLIAKRGPADNFRPGHYNQLMNFADGRARRIAAVTGAALIAAIMLWFASWRGTDELAIWPLDLIWTFLTSAPLALGWVAAAAGFGWPVRVWLLRGDQRGALLQIGLGIAIMLGLDATLGTAGVLQWGGAAGAWATLGPGWLLLAAQLIRNSRRVKGAESHLPHPLVWCAAPAIAVLLTAACSTPGWLWESEFGGYDALSYHLQLPKEWMAFGAIRPLEHNVYSFLPGYVEAAYYHLALLRGDAIQSAYAAQLLHTFITIAAACAIGRLIQSLLISEAAGAIAMVLALGTPWTIVVGSLAYNEMFVVLFLACSGLIAAEQTHCARKRGFAIGLLAGAAVGAKLTAAGFVALPLGAMMLVTLPLRQCVTIAMFAAASCTAMLLPYLMRNGIAAGNPVFPFATDVFGQAHWTVEQAVTWRRGHMSDVGISDRLTALWNQLMRYGWGPAPVAESGEPWKPQWSVLFLLGMGGAVAAAVRRPRTSPMARGLLAMLVVQIAYWAFFTHLQSRFMLPALVPLVGLAVLGGFAIAHRLRQAGHPRAFFALAILSTLWAAQPALIFVGENQGAPAARIGLIDFMTGQLHASQLARATTESERLELLATAPPALFLNTLLPRNARTLLVGDAAPFYYTGDIAYQTTWDRGPMSEALRTGSDPIAHLRAAGFTHVLINLGMLERWAQSAWNDPLLTPESVLDALEPQAQLLQVWENGAVRLYELPD